MRCYPDDGSIPEPIDEVVVATHPDLTADIYPDWLLLDCGCCSGLKWDGDYLRECDFCKGREQSHSMNRQAR